MAGLIGGVSNLSGSGLVGFLSGNTAATSTGVVEQFRNNLRYDFGDIISGASADGTVFDIRVNGPEDYEFSNNLSFASSAAAGVVDGGDVLSIDASIVVDRLEKHDVSRLAYGLLLAAKGEIDENELNENPAYSSLFVLDLKDALDRLNVDSERPFRVNGVEFEIFDDEIRINSRPGEAASKKVRRDPEIAKLQKSLEQKQATLGGSGEKIEVPVEGATVNELVGVREILEFNFDYVAYDFDGSNFVGSNDFSDILPLLSQVPDSVFFGANMAYQLEDALGNTVSQTVKNEVFPVAMNYFANLLLGAVTSLPTQIRDEFESHALNALTRLYGGDQGRAQEQIDAIRPVFDSLTQNLIDTIFQVPVGADLQELRSGIGASLSGGIYSVTKFSNFF